ncbi:DUF3748 domain-containing protein [Dyadobacter sp. Leaf189]|uniref:DUF3748 domain-containing protein n=1 Tax=Dyadobacter sp. Leaf189 TaxID=1736295 RepID=UPI00070184BC|nr:DUF3748 domain-containing protein [Dyadobacter sp. Leaf189]KQS33009.1 hypothetical protein ASG33_02670 [Dyadobacter sp. Leaf189]
MVKYLVEKQLTFDLSYHHDLDNNDNFSPDGKWLAYDTRTDIGGIPESARIEKVCIESGEVRIIYQIPDNAKWGPGAGAVSYSPVEDAVVFIHGLSSCTADNPYQQWRRTGVIVRGAEPGKPVFMDARNIDPPFTPGALRGGTHRHEWSGDGKWIGFTYNDAILKALEDASGTKRNLRTIGVSANIGPVDVPATPENVPGEWFSVVVVRVVPQPQPGSDEINHAANDSWIGKKGYVRPDGSLQLARAFLGTVVDSNGNEVPEVFVVDIPDDITKPGPLSPLEGTASDFPMPPAGTVQRRITFTANSAFPGCSGIVRSSPDGSKLAFLAKDENGITQIFTISPLGGEASQLTNHDSDVKGNVRWHPGGGYIAYVWEERIMICEIGNASFQQRIRVLTAPSEQAPANLVWSHDGQVLACNRLVEDASTGGKTQQIFVLTNIF